MLQSVSWTRVLSAFNFILFLILLLTYLYLSLSLTFIIFILTLILFTEIDINTYLIQLKNHGKWKDYVSNRYLASGMSQKDVAHYFRVGRSTVSGIIREVCDCLWQVLAPKEMGQPDQEQWRKISEEFKRRWDFPHCLGKLQVFLNRYCSFKMAVSPGMYALHMVLIIRWMRKRHDLPCHTAWICISLTDFLSPIYFGRSFWPHGWDATLLPPPYPGSRIPESSPHCR